MKKKTIIITAIIGGLLLSALLIIQILSMPTKLKLLLPNETENIGNDSILIRIDQNETFFINGQITTFDALPTMIDSLGSNGYNDSIIILEADKKVMVSTVVMVMEYSTKAKKKLIFKTN